MGFELDVTIPAITVFLQGILSFFSPCILPIIPLYMGYLSGGSLTTNPDGSKNFSQKKAFVHTVFFIIGVSFAFFLLGLGFTAFGQFFSSNQMLLARIGGIFVILLGLVQLDILSKPFNGKQFQLPLNINITKMNPITALVMGFVFSFAWTPCVGPALSTVLIMVSSSNSTATGLMLVAVYTVGFTIPFLALGLFTTQCLVFFKKHDKMLDYTVKIGGALMVLMGVMMFTGMMNSVTGYLSNFSGILPSETQSQSTSSTPQQESQPSTENSQSTADTTPENQTPAEEIEEEKVPAIDFTIMDQFGETHSLADYKGKVIFLNIWATWCPPCRAEMPDIQKLYENYGYNQEDVMIFGVAFPNDQNKYTSDGTAEEITAFLEENNYSYPTLLDMSGELLTGYGISSFPTTFMIDTDGNIFGYLPGMMTYDIMESIVSQTVAASFTDIQN